MDKKNNKFIPVWIKNSLKQLKKTIKKIKKTKQDRFTLENFKKTLIEVMGIKSGDTIIIHSSFSRLNPEFSPYNAIDCLMDIIGSEGNILMPYYPPMLSFLWLMEDNIFDLKNTKSSMGILTQIFSEYSDVKKSIHPTKSLAVWGKKRDELIAEHHLSTTPFDKKSPYYKLITLANSKTIGIGIEKNSFFHCCEDLMEGYPERIYSQKLFRGKCIDYDGNQVCVKTYAHDPHKIKTMVSPCAYLINTKCPTYNRKKVKDRLFYSVENRSVFTHVKKNFSAGIDRETIKKKSKYL